jgi:7-cyano-7-deazaguanine synthase in queuosine biosynthesis
MSETSNIDSKPDPTKGKAVMLFSGGVDSFVGWFRMGKPDLLWVRINHRYATAEWKAVSKLEEAIPELGAKLGKIDNLQGIGQWEKPDAEIPARNLILAIAAAERGYSRIGLVCQQDERSIPDRSVSFFEHAGNMLSSLFGRPITMDPVFSDMDKTDMIHWFLGVGIGYEGPLLSQRIEWLKLTTACYTPVGMHVPSTTEAKVLVPIILQCGDCPACFRRAIAFTLSDVEETYNTDPWKSPTAKTYFERAISGKYGEKRSQRIVKALEKHGSITYYQNGWRWAV